jgi:hypothetical protein
VRTVYPTGTTLYQPERCWNGYTLLFRGLEVKLVDMNGRMAHAWALATEVTKCGTDRARLLTNGNVLVSRGGMHSEDGVLEELDWEGDVAWRYIPEGKIPHTCYLGPHHDVFRKANGNTLLICRQAVPEEYLGQVREPAWQGQAIYGDTILEVDRVGKTVWEWHSHEHLDLNHRRLLASPKWPPGPLNSTVLDWTHVNTVRSLPENRWYDAGDTRFRPGNVLISPRQLDTIYLIDRETHEIVWEYSGDYFGGLSGQHEPYMIEKGLPGAGNILIFDNGASPWNDLGHAGASYVLEVDPITKQVVWVYDCWQQFHSTYTSSAQRLENGNTLICESNSKRVFEVTSEGETVWEYVDFVGTPRAYRYAYGHCPQTAELGLPREAQVTPPARLMVPPDEPIDE